MRALIATISVAVCSVQSAIFFLLITLLLDLYFFEKEVCEMKQEVKQRLVKIGLFCFYAVFPILFIEFLILFVVLMERIVTIGFCPMLLPLLALLLIVTGVLAFLSVATYVAILECKKLFH